MDTAKGIPGAAVQFLRIARLFDVSARTEDAARAYLSAFSEGAAPSALFSAFLLFVEMNDLAGMQKSLAPLTGQGGSAELLLGALFALQSGDDASAQATLIALATQTGEPDLALKAMWILYQRSTARGDISGQTAARLRLSTRFPDAPETAVAVAASFPPGQAQAVAAASPWPFYYLRDETQPAVSPAPSSQPAVPISAGNYSVQAGAFQMKENADDLAGELSRHGLFAMIIHEIVQGKDRYRVLAATGLSGDVARAVVQKLGELGYSGFLIPEK